MQLPQRCVECVECATYRASTLSTLSTLHPPSDMLVFQSLRRREVVQLLMRQLHETTVLCVQPPRFMFSDREQPALCLAHGWHQNMWRPRVAT